MSGATATTDESATSSASATGEENETRARIKRIALYAVLGGMAVFYLVPIETGLMTAITRPETYTGSTPYLPPLEPLVPGTGRFSLQPIGNAFDGLSRGLVNSFILVVPATILSGLFGSMAAYGLTNVDWRGQVGIYALFIAGIFIPYQAVLVPLTQFWYNVVPLRTMFLPLAGLPFVQEYHWKLVALIVTHTAYGIPICTLLFRAHYKKLSGEMIEAARLDGASVATIYRRIVLPLSIPMFAVVFIYQFTQIWNDLLFALTIVQFGDASVVTQELVGIGTSQSGTNYPLRMAASLLAALPTLVVYILFGDKFADGVTA
ncbi:carbohydrate ABC transporter permease [Natrinema sp. 1APR25-10V2]|uniref:carbohydrate ABC transporter permease n=1 Tax=Natrinema sp. 1APR25-10V2 TaxID=2951081 RepID=UPI0028745716|nr:carbohydrate ABC transporter permease [Natrinema sp. 1APR25-10V2]MDS0476245.1 carbohydrate ABC transporter permease [Natrinema sp. 1APR25-10V2]